MAYILLHLKCGCSSGVERDLAKVDVEGSNPFARSNLRPVIPVFFLWLRDFHPTGSSIPTSIRNDLPVELIVFHWLLCQNAIHRMFFDIRSFARSKNKIVRKGVFFYWKWWD